MSGSILTVGTFDGVHVAHTALIERARELAGRLGEGIRVVALAFDPHPMSELRPQACPARLSTFAQRRAWLGELGVDEVVRLRPTRELLGLGAEAFIERLVSEHGMVGIVEGDDFQFGAGRVGDVTLLGVLGERLGFAVEVVEAVEVDLSDQSIVRASSSMARRLIEHGRMLDAQRVLGRPYELVGEVVRGERRGRELGYPTANLRTEQLPPADGVYACRAMLDDGREFDAALSVGTNPQFDTDGSGKRSVEAYLLDVPRDGDRIEGLGEYGWTLRLEVCSWLRNQMTFDGVDALVAQIGRDVARVPEAIIEASRAWRGLEQAAVVRSGLAGN